jgi:hypothetical protein
VKSSRDAQLGGTYGSQITILGLVEYKLIIIVLKELDRLWRFAGDRASALIAIRSDLVNLEHFVPIMVDDLDGDPARGGGSKR